VALISFGVLDPLSCYACRRINATSPDPRLDFHTLRVPQSSRRPVGATVRHDGHMNDRMKTTTEPVPPGDAVPVILAEYQSLRAEVDHYSQRIDRITGVYITALFAVVGFMLRPDLSFAPRAYFDGILLSRGLTVLLLCIPVLNSVLLIRSGSFYLALLSIAQYTHYEIRPKISACVGVDCLNWDRDPVFHAKRHWIPLRGLGQTLFSFLAEGLSLGILVYVAWNGGIRDWLTTLAFMVSSFFVVLSWYALATVAFTGCKFHSPMDGLAPQTSVDDHKNGAKQSPLACPEGCADAPSGSAGA